MTEWLFSRTRIRPPFALPAEEVAGWVFFDTWRTKRQPYSLLAEGDAMWWVDPSTRQIRWQLEARHVLQRPYAGVDEAIEMVRTAYGLVPEDTSGLIESRPEGYLLAWAVAVGQTVDVTLPAGVRLGRDGYRRVDDELRATLTAAGLPPPSPHRLASAPEWMDAGLLTDPVPDLDRRSIPLGVRDEVWRRDGGRCQWPGCSAHATNSTMHVDHIIPWSKGGASEVENLQLLCAPHNLSKGARIEDPTPTPAAMRAPLDELARALGCRRPRNESDLPQFLSDAVTEGHADLALAVLHDIVRRNEVASELALSCVDACSGVPDRNRDRLSLERLYAVDHPLPLESLRTLSRSSDPEVVGEAACLLAESDTHIAPDERRRLFDLTKDVADPRIAGFALIRLAELVGDASEQRLLLEQAGEANDAEVRAAAALELFHLNLSEISDSDTDEAIVSTAIPLLYRAMASSDIDASVEASYWLAVCVQGNPERALIHAQRGERCTDPDISSAASKLRIQLEEEIAAKLEQPDAHQ